MPISKKKKHAIMDEKQVMKKIRELAEKQKANQPVGIDTLALILHANEVTLMEVLTSLEHKGEISILPSPTRSRRRTGSGSIVVTSVPVNQ